jgi:hypothetical protein
MGVRELVKDITDKDIDNVWYVKAIKERASKAVKKKKAPAVKKDCSTCKHFNRGYMMKLCTGCSMNNAKSKKLLWEYSDAKA